MDPNQDQYVDDPAILVLNICRSVFKGYAKTYSLGMPSQPFTDLDYPAVVVQKMKSVIDIGATKTDAENERIVIMIFSNKADQAGGPNDPGVTTLRELENRIEGKKPYTGSGGDSTAYNQWQPNTLVYQLRNQYTLGNQVIKSALEIDYDTLAQVDENGKRTTAITMAAVTMSFTERIIVPSRT